MAQRVHLLVALLLTTTLCVKAALHDAEEEELALTHFFAQMDNNRDGKVDEAEAKKYIEERIGGREFDSTLELTEAFQHMVNNIDKDGTEHNTISVAEVKQHLRQLQHAVSVKEWVQHGLGLPQYAEAFRENMITAADFPLLVDEECKIFENELQISSRLHKNQIVRGMKRLMLGLGELPSSPQIISCIRASTSQSVLQWASPVRSGDPPIHKYLIESLELDRGGASWMVAADIEAHLNQKEYSQHVRHTSGRQLFRIVAWTAYGPSQYSVFNECELSAKSPDSESENGQSYSDYRLEPQRVAELALAQIVSSMNHQTKEIATEDPGSGRTGYWSLFVIALTVVLRMLTSRNIAIVKCCFLWKLESIATKLKLKHLAVWLSKIKRNECKCCQERCHKQHAGNQATSHHPSLVQMKAKSHKTEPTQHFGIDDAKMVFSKSSPALGDPKVNYPFAEWDPAEAASSVEKLPIPAYKVTSWDGSEGTLTSSTQSMTSSNDVPSGLIEGQCAFEGCLREWKGMLQFRNRWSRHFCSICLRTYCFEHTHISPHGSFGSCGQHSSCVCVVCFPKLPPATRAQLEATNKLDKSPSKRADLERGCTRRDGHNHMSVRALLGRRRQESNKTSKIHPET